MKKQFYLILSLLISHQYLFSQMPNVISPSPNAAALAKIVETPVSLFNGTPNITIPLYEIVEGDIRVPITLSYHASGIKVSEDASWVGLGWNLSSGGQIVVNQMGKSDNEFEYGFGKYRALPTLLNRDFDMANIEFISDDYCNFIPESGSNPDFCSFGQHNQGVDGEPDTYIFSFLEYSGKFIHRRYFENGQLKLKAEVVDRQNIEFFLNSQGIDAIAPNGFKFKFNSIETSYSALGNSNIAPQPSSYKLTEINSTQGKRVRFEYNPAQRLLVSTPNISFAKSYLRYGESRDNAGNYSHSYTYAKDLEVIRFSSGYVKFHSSPRDDVRNGLKLDSIEVYQNGKSIPVKKIVFSYDYYNGDSKYGDFYPSFSGVSNSEYKNNVNYRSKRLRLNRVQINDENPYVFHYNQEPLPFKTSLAIDYWGFFNGSQNNNTLLPNGVDLNKFYNVPAAFQFWKGANREPNEIYIKAGILESIVYPTGGIVRFKYSGHRYNNFLNRTVKVLKKIIAADCSTYMNNNLGVKDTPYNELLVFNETTTIKVNIGIHASTIFNKNTCFVGFEKWDDVNNYWLIVQGLRWDIYDLGSICMNNNPNDGCLINGDGSYIVDIRDAIVTLSPGKYRVVCQYPSSDNSTSIPRMAHFSFDTFVNQNVGQLMGGGLRIDQIENDLVDGLKIIKKYDYEGGWNYSIPVHSRYVEPYSRYNTCQPVPAYNGIYKNEGHMLFSNFLVSYSNSANGSVVGYSSVTESYIGQEKGKNVYTFFNSDYGTTVIRDICLPGMPTVNKIDNGMLKSQTVFAYNSITNTYIPIKKNQYYYSLFNKLLLWGFKSEYETTYHSGIFPNSGFEPIPYSACGSLRLQFYPIRMAEVKMTQNEEWNYHPEGQIYSLTNYQYNNKGFEKSVETTNSNGNIKTSIKTYSSDYTDLDWIKLMRDRNMIGIPIEVVEKVDNNVTSGSFTKYGLISNLLVPLELYDLKVSEGQLFVSSLATNGIMSPMFNLLGTIDYYSNGNIKSTKTRSGVNTVYLWGHNDAYPIAKIEGSETNDVFLNSLLIDYISQLQNYKVLNDGIINELKLLNGSIRNLASDKLFITTYTYDPLIGMTSQTDPNGITTYYEYDGFGRLKHIKDQDGNILQKFDYHYKESAGN